MPMFDIKFFRKKSKNCLKYSAYRAHTGHLMDHTWLPQGAYRASIEHIQNIYRAYTGHIQGSYRAPTEHLQGI